MLIHGLQRTRPARVITVVAVLCFLWIWLSNIQGVNLTQDLLPSYQRTVPDLGAGAGSNALAKTTHQRSRIGKVTVAANKLDSDIITRALQSHERQNERHGYIHFIAKNQAVSSLIENDRYHRPKGAWTKPAYLLSIIVAELQKPEEERLEWVYWFDADTLVLNTETPLEVFLPPKNSTELSTVDLIITNNWDGLNSGVFALRVSPWSASLLSAVLAYPVYEATRLSKDRFRDQSAFQFLLEGKESPLVETPMASRDRWAKVPMRWFNSLPVNNAFYKNGTWIFGKNMTAGLFDNGTTKVYNDGHGGKVNPWKVMQGDMIVHFAGTSAVRDSWMRPWIERAEAMLPEWNNATTKYVLQEEAAEFWEKTEKQLVIDRAKSKIEEAEKEKVRKEKERQAKKEKEEKEKKEKERLEQQRREKERKVEEKEKKKEAAVTAIPKVLKKVPKPTVPAKIPTPPAPPKVNATASPNATVDHSDHVQLR